MSILGLTLHAVCSRKFLPTLAAHLDEINFDLTMLTTSWFMCLFVNVLPPATVMRIWDVLLTRGPKILFKVAVTMFACAESWLLETFEIWEVRLFASVSASPCTVG